MSNEEEKIAKIKPQSPCKRWKTKKLGKNEYWTPNSFETKNEEKELLKKMMKDKEKEHEKRANRQF